MKVDFALQFIDYMTGGMVEDIVVSANDGSVTPIKNTQGYFVFVNLEFQKLNVEVNSRKYATLRMEICLPTEKLQKVVLLPKDYVTNGVSFELKPFENVNVGTVNRLISLMQNIKGGDKYVRIYAPNAVGLSGFPYIIRYNNGRLGEKLFFSRRLQDGKYQLLNDVTADYVKRECKLMPLIPVQADSKGILRLPPVCMGVSYKKEDLVLE